MKEKFLKELSRELMPLSKNERDRYLSDFNEIISDKMEDGISEKEAVSDLGNVKMIAKDILNLYRNDDSNAFTKSIKYSNKIYLIFDIAALLISYLLTCYLYFSSSLYDTTSGALPISAYMVNLLFIVPVYIILYYIFHLYTINYISQPFLEMRNILIANIIGLLIVFLILFLFKQVDISRNMLVIFAGIHLVIEIIVRRILSKCFQHIH